ncbi:hypothetical protein JG687_00000641 [Phytophthora cactorum]|uniref:C2H2-type domain-containing protein n=1 Tax=Phytophthora cactorum TaxID=29920 RepID=A0A8T1V303_9STRA|nr:Zinc finger C2H2-type/integrase DNA-binding domain [Phytophthora cactorum]KAG6973886.1 hypothetical protein JG687_00000641 [Phytophthora cactorum]
MNAALRDLKVGRPRQRKPRTCWKCAKVFARPANLRRHLQKKFKCDKKSRKAQNESRKAASRQSSRVYYLKSKLERAGGLLRELVWVEPPSALASAKSLSQVFPDVI